MADKPASGGNAVLTAVLTGATVHLMTGGVGGTEVPGGLGYSSQNFGTVTPSGGTAANLADIVFGTSTGSWGTVNAVLIKKTGVIIWQKAFTGTPIAAGNSVKFAAGALSVNESLGHDHQRTPGPPVLYRHVC